MDLELLKQEMKEFGNGADACVVFDFGIINHAKNLAENLDFSFSLGMEEITDIKINRRYPNKNYCTITRKYGRKLSKVGYPYMINLDEMIDAPILLVVKVGEKDTDNYLEMIFPLEVHLSKEKPFLRIQFLIDKEFGLKISSSRYSTTSYKVENIVLTNRPDEYVCDYILSTPSRSGEHTVIYGDVLGIIDEDKFDKEYERVK